MSSILVMPGVPRLTSAFRTVSTAGAGFRPGQWRAGPAACRSADRRSPGHRSRCVLSRSCRRFVARLVAPPLRVAVVVASCIARLVAQRCSPVARLSRSVPSSCRNDDSGACSSSPEVWAAPGRPTGTTGRTGAACGPSTKRPAAGQPDDPEAGPGRAGMVSEPLSERFDTTAQVGSAGCGTVQRATPTGSGGCPRSGPSPALARAR